MLILGETCLQIKKHENIPRKSNVEKLQYDKDVSDSNQLRSFIKIWLRETLISFQNRNIIISPYSIRK